MKKIGGIFGLMMGLILVIGCSSMIDSPTKKVEDLLSKYKMKNMEVLKQLDDVVSEAGTMNDKQKNSYHELMERQYENLEYKIKEEKIDGNNATVIVEIEVIDYGKAIENSENYLASNRSEFLKDDGTDMIDPIKFLDYKIGEMKRMKDRIKYTINFTLTKKDKEWVIDDLSDIDRLKLHGLYY